MNGQAQETDIPQVITELASLGLRVRLNRWGKLAFDYSPRAVCSQAIALYREHRYEIESHLREIALREPTWR